MHLSCWHSVLKHYGIHLNQQHPIPKCLSTACVCVQYQKRAWINNSRMHQSRSGHSNEKNRKKHNNNSEAKQGKIRERSSLGMGRMYENMVNLRCYCVWFVYSLHIDVNADHEFLLKMHLCMGLRVSVCARIFSFPRPISRFPNSRITIKQKRELINFCWLQRVYSTISKIIHPNKPRHHPKHVYII